MCTLTIQKNDDRLLVTMNRDEQRDRLEEYAPFLWQSTKIFAPQDSQAHGTWIGTNEKGEVAALLNGYQGTDANKAMQSRGEIIPKILSGQNIDPKNYNSFHLIHINNQQIMYSSWDGKNFEENILPLKQWAFFTSSGVRQDEIKQARLKEFEEWKKRGAGFIGKLPAIHLQKQEGDDACSVLMARDDACTKSITQYEITPNDQICRYWPNPQESSENKEYLEYKGLF